MWGALPGEAARFFYHLRVRWSGRDRSGVRIRPLRHEMHARENCFRVALPNRLEPPGFQPCEMFDGFSAGRVAEWHKV